MMSTYPPGSLYACFPRPFEFFIRFVWNDYTDIEYYPPPTPEWGLHYTTIVTYALFMIFGIISFERDGIKKPFHKLAYVFLLGITTFFVPFELFYITLYDIFHSIPKFGSPLIWLFGSWKPPPENIFEFFTRYEVVFYDVGLPILCFICMWWIYNDLKETYPNLKLRLDKNSLLYFSLFLFVMFLWVIIPVHTEVVGWGTKWFPQTIYIDYGNFTELGLKWGKEDYGIIAEYWFPNPVIKWHNVIAKLISVLFMFYTFIPRNVSRN